MINPAYEELSVRQQCALLDLSRSGLYYRPRVRHEDTALANELHDIWMEMPFYGCGRLTAERQRRGYEISHKRVSRLMREMNIEAEGSLYKALELCMSILFMDTVVKLRGIDTNDIVKQN